MIKSIVLIGKEVNLISHWLLLIFFFGLIITGVLVTLVASSTIREKRQNEPDGINERYAFDNQQPGFNNNRRQQGGFGQGNFGQGSLFGQGNQGQGNFGQGNQGQTNPGTIKQIYINLDFELISKIDLRQVTDHVCCMR